MPFHSWTPDVYQGSPSPVVAYMASGVKAAGFAGLLRVFVVTFGTYRVDWQPVVYVLAVLSLLVGAVLAVVQTDVKRMMAYSSINHAGFILVGGAGGHRRGRRGRALLPGRLHVHGGRHASASSPSWAGRGDARHSLDDYRGLAKARPVLALAFTVLLLAQAGVPLTVGLLRQVRRDRRPRSTLATGWR